MLVFVYLAAMLIGIAMGLVIGREFDSPILGGIATFLITFSLIQVFQM